MSAVDAILLATVTVWSLNFTASKYVLNQGFGPLSYASLRYVLAAVLFAAITLAREGSLRVSWRDAGLLLVPAGGVLFVNQLGFIYGLKFTTASTVALVLGTVPVFVGLLSWAFGLDRLRLSFWVAAALSFGGVALIAVGSGSVSADLKGDLLAVLMSASWAAYSLLVAPALARYSPWRVTTIVMSAMSVGLLALGSRQLSTEDFGFGALVWLSFAYSVAGPLVAGQVLWFTAVERIGTSRASLFVNLQPFLGVLFALLLLSEHLTRLEVAGGLLIAASIVLERRSHARNTARFQEASPGIQAGTDPRRGETA
jgi:drug/metabolite transporter (DMT)-like permease